MIESIEGKRGMQDCVPVYREKTFAKPTLAHNMETLYWVRDIIEKEAIGSRTMVEEVRAYALFP